jgi:hypothetical protein
MAELKVSLKELGMKDQTEETYKLITDTVESLDELDKARLLYYITTQIIKDEMKMHPVAIISLMETIQNTEIQCAKLKKMLGDTVISGIECKKCKTVLPNMTILHHINGLNSQCPHTEIDVEIKKG